MNYSVRPASGHGLPIRARARCLICAKDFMSRAALIWHDRTWHPNWIFYRAKS